jgi:hypothetical protein
LPEGLCCYLHCIDIVTHHIRPCPIFPVPDNGPAQRTPDLDSPPFEQGLPPLIDLKLFLKSTDLLMDMRVPSGEDIMELLPVALFLQLSEAAPVVVAVQGVVAVIQIEDVAQHINIKINAYIGRAAIACYQNQLPNANTQ